MTFQRLWYEVEYFKWIWFSDIVETKNSKLNGTLVIAGKFKKWSNNDEYVVNWQHNGEEIKSFRNTRKVSSKTANTKYFKEGLTWNKLSSSKFSVKYKPSDIFLMIQVDQRLWMIILFVLCYRATMF